MKSPFQCGLFLLVVFQLHASFVHAKNHSQKVSLRNTATRIFGSYKGCFALYDMQNNRWVYIHNKQLCNQRLAPCSTFKIPHTLLALELGITTSKTVFRWDGKKRFYKAWNRDQTLSTALRYSAVWVYQRIARKIGRKKMKHWLNKLRYGDQQVKGPLHRFWLHEGALTISAVEQIDFLRRFLQHRLPVRKEVVQQVRQWMPAQTGKHGVVQGKTGSLLKQGTLQLGWFVGWVKTKGKFYLFATHVRGKKRVWGAKARKITLRILKQLKLF